MILTDSLVRVRSLFRNKLPNAKRARSYRHVRGGVRLRRCAQSPLDCRLGLVSASYCDSIYRYASRWQSPLFMYESADQTRDLGIDRTFHSESSIRTVRATSHLYSRTYPLADRIISCSLLNVFTRVLNYPQEDTSFV
jgi:hypothetical protein